MLSNAKLFEKVNICIQIMSDFEIFYMTIRDRWYGAWLKLDSVLKLLESHCIYTRLENTIHCKTLRQFVLDLISGHLFDLVILSVVCFVASMHVILFKPNLTFRSDLHSMQCLVKVYCQPTIIFQNFRLLFIITVFVLWPCLFSKLF